jgi:orotate phosphoribosyltransferase
VERDYGCQVISIITLKELIAYLEENRRWRNIWRQFAPIVKPTASDDAPGSLGCRISAISA